MSEYRCLSVNQPYAQLIVIGKKRFEIRSKPTKYRGELLIASTIKRPETWQAEDGPLMEIWDSEDNPERCLAQICPSEDGDGRWWLYTEADPVWELHQLHFGAILGSVKLTDCLPIWDADEFAASSLTPEDRVIVIGPPRRTDQVQTWDGNDWHNITDQLPYCPFKPGMWAWVLEDAKPVEERCPNSSCYQGLVFGVFGVFGDEEADDEFGSCPTCHGKGTCNPLPVRGRRGIYVVEL